MKGKKIFFTKKMNLKNYLLQYGHISFKKWGVFFRLTVVGQTANLTLGLSKLGQTNLSGSGRLQAVTSGI